MVTSKSKFICYDIIGMEKALSLLLLFACLPVGQGCSGRISEVRILKIATTTSVENSGLLNVLLPAFEKESGIKIHAISVGTGRALKLAENGDVDIVLVHCPEMEKEFVNKGFGVQRKEVFYNDFVIVGPEKDPARIKNFKKARAAFKKIAKEKSLFISRGDNSGTHKKELSIWGRADLTGKWYLETGQGMGITLNIAYEKGGYCLVDRGTFISYEDRIDLVILLQGDPSLKNIYSIIAVNPAERPYIKYKEADTFTNWVISEKGKFLINGFKINGKRLFHSPG